MSWRVGLVVRRFTAQMRVLDSEPFYLRVPDSVGILLLHGFLGNPVEVQALGAALHDQGISAVAPRLPGHYPPHYAGIERCGFRDWLESAEDALSSLRHNCDRVYVCGCSMGGVLALNLAAHCAVAGVITINSPVSMAHPLTEFLGKTLLRLMKPLKLRLRIGISPDVRNLSVRRELQEQGRHTVFSVPIIAYLELLNLISATRPGLARIRCPALIIQSRHDRVVSPRSALSLYALLGSVNKEIVWLENSGHVALMDNEQDGICERITAFIRRSKGDGESIGD